MKKIALIILIAVTGLTLRPLNAQNMKIKITTRNKEFTATLNDCDAAKELVKMLPMEITMDEHNNNEKYYNLPSRMSGKASNPGRIQAGDLMIWSSNTLVLFYAGSSTSYSYIRLGRVDNPSGLEAALGSGSVTVKFEMQ